MNTLRIVILLVATLLTSEVNAVDLIPATGMFGGALDARRNVAIVNHRPEFALPPVTIECWIKIKMTGDYNIIMANRKKESARHWEIYSEPLSGTMIVYMPGSNPGTFSCDRQIADDKWHYIAAIIESKRLRLYVDGDLVSDKKRIDAETDATADEGPLYIGGYPPMVCDGLIDEVRISSGVREIKSIPTEPFTRDDATLGLWHFDRPSAGTYEEIDRLVSASVQRMNDEHALLTSPGATLDENDRIAFDAKTTPFDRPMKAIKWAGTEPGKLGTGYSAGSQEVFLHGKWDCVEAKSSGVSEDVMMTDASAWKEAFSAKIPCSIQTALFEAGKIADPVALKNNLDIQWVAEREWWLRKIFIVPHAWKGKRVTLFFDGVDYRATFWLNGKRLGQHEGMFGGPDFDVTNAIRYGGENTLLVSLDPAPPNYEDTLKNNVAYGWHYVKLITLGIWRPVRLQVRGETQLDSPFLKTAKIEPGAVKTQMSLDIRHDADTSQSLTFECRLTPKNFKGEAYLLRQQITVKPGLNHIGFEGTLKGAKLWWPSGMGAANLYWMDCALKNAGHVIDQYACNWGARTIEMRPANNDPKPFFYNWQFVVNGQPIWVKGANWCYPDPLLRLDRTRQKRMLEIARDGNVQFLRIWGGGPVENDELYDLCDEMGIMTQQEFSMLGYHRLQNIPSIHATDITHYTVRRLRNRPSLVIWCGSNETPGIGRVHQNIGRRCLELDSTRPFHRSCPAGGDLHWYGVYWGQEPLLNYRSWARKSAAFTEFGLSSPAAYESWKRVLPSDEWDSWPAKQDSVFVHHTPTFDAWHIGGMERYTNDFRKCKNLREMVDTMQLAQGLGLKFCIETMRSRKPESTATYIYKLTEDYPACSWATIDYYGVPKISHYYVREAYKPVHVMALYDEWDSADGKLPVAISAVNDTAVPVSGKLAVTLYDGRFNVLTREESDLTIPIEKALKVSDKTYSVAQAKDKPLFLCVDFKGNDGVMDRNWYFFDFASSQGSLYNRPKTTLAADLEQSKSGLAIRIRNTGDVPAVSVDFDLGEACFSYYVDDTGIWLNPGEEKTITLHKSAAVDGQDKPLKQIKVSAWNADYTVVGR